MIKIEKELLFRRAFIAYSRLKAHNYKDDFQEAYIKGAYETLCNLILSLGLTSDWVSYRDTHSCDLVNCIILNKDAILEGWSYYET